MEKIINLSKTVFELCKDDPEILDIMKELGFTDITNPAMMKTAGRFMTIPKGAKMKGIPMEKVKEVFQDKGYKIEE
jgi:hypothetical protein